MTYTAAGWTHIVLAVFAVIGLAALVIGGIISRRTPAPEALDHQWHVQAEPGPLAAPYDWATEE